MTLSAAAESASNQPFDRRAIPAGAVVDRWAAPDGWPLRRIRWPAPQGQMRGSILFSGGRGDHYEKYLETFEDWRSRGWQVESFDWRGQGGSGRVGADRFVGDIDAFATWIDDYAAYVADWRGRCTAPHVIVGHSMGGHLLLRALAEQRVTPDAAILIAPMLGFTAPYSDRLGVAVAGIMARLGDPGRAAWKVSEKPGSPVRMRQLLLTHDAERYADDTWWHEHASETLLGPASWRWVLESYRSFVGLAQSGTLEGITTPLLILATGADKLVSAAAIRRAIARLPVVTSHIYGSEAAHEILREADGVRDDALRRIDAFLDATVPGR